MSRPGRGMSRRDLLAALLGAPLAWAACKRPRPPPVEGVIAGANDAAGHRLRTGDVPVPASRRRVPVVIAGGGVAGLSAAWRLRRAGFLDFELVELDGALGGTSRSGDGGPVPHPWGAHYLPCPGPDARWVSELLIEAGVAERLPDGQLSFDEAQLCRAPQERLYVADRWYDGLYPRAGASAGDLQQLARFQGEMQRLGRLRDARGRPAFTLPIGAGSDDADFTALDRITMAEWLGQRGFDSPRLRWYVEYGCRDDFGAPLEATSAWAGLHYFASRLEGGEAGATGETADLLTWPEGNARLVAHLARGLSQRLRTGVMATRVRPLERGAEVWTFEPATGRAEALEADQVICALPSFVAARVMDDAARMELARALPVGAWMVANLTLRRRPRSRGFPEAWDNVLYRSPSLGYVVATHQLDPGDCLEQDAGRCARRAPSGGGTVWTYYLPFTEVDPGAGRRLLFQMAHADAVELVLADLGRAHPDLAECVTRIDVWRWGHAMVRPSPGVVHGQARRALASPAGSVHFAHSDLSGLPLFEEANHQGIRAAEEVLARRGLPQGR